MHKMTTASTKETRGWAWMAPNSAAKAPNSAAKLGPPWSKSSAKTAPASYTTSLPPSATKACSIDVVLINTEATKALDVFYVTKSGAPLTPEQESQLSAALESAVRPA